MASLMNRAGVLALAILTGTIGAVAASGLQAQETARGAYNTPIWKTIILGTYRNANDMREALDSTHCRVEKVTFAVAGKASSAIPIYNDGPMAPYCHLEGSANEIIGRPAFTLTRTKTEVDLVVLSVFELGFGEHEGGSGVSIKDIYARAELLGFELCPPEVGPQLRLQYLDQSPGEVLHIAMRPIMKYDGELVVLEIESSEAGLVLFGHKVGALDRTFSRALFVFVKPRYGASWN